VEKTSSSQWIATARTFSTSLFGLATFSTGGDGGDSVPPELSQFKLTGGNQVCDDSSNLCETSVLFSDVRFDQSGSNTIVATGDLITLSIDLYENSGPSSLEHLSLYMNLRGFEREVHHSDTFILYQKGNPIIVEDPHGYFSQVDLIIVPDGNKLVATFYITFAKPMATSDIIFRSWDFARNSVDARFTDFISVIEPTPKLNAVDEGIVEGFSVSAEIHDSLMMWAESGSDSMSDSELLHELGITGEFIPDWYKRNIIQWMIKENLVTFEEFIDALKDLSKRGFLRD